MPCKECGGHGGHHKPSCAFSPAVLQITNKDCTIFHRVEIPAAMGDETTVPPANGKYRNVLLTYEASGNAYLYSSDGIPTKLTFATSDYNALENKPAINGVTLEGDLSSEDLHIEGGGGGADMVELEIRDIGGFVQNNIRYVDDMLTFYNKATGEEYPLNAVIELIKNRTPFCVHGIFPGSDNSSTDTETEEQRETRLSVSVSPTLYRSYERLDGDMYQVAGSAPVGYSDQGPALTDANKVYGWGIHIVGFNGEAVNGFAWWQLGTEN